MKSVFIIYDFLGVIKSDRTLTPLHSDRTLTSLHLTAITPPTSLQK